jgi:hypothetical protein
VSKRNITVVYSTTSSARSKTDWGIVSPSVLAVFMLINISILVGCSTEDRQALRL